MLHTIFTIWIHMTLHNYFYVGIYHNYQYHNLILLLCCKHNILFTSHQDFINNLTSRFDIYWGIYLRLQIFLFFIKNLKPDAINKIYVSMYNYIIIFRIFETRNYRGKFSFNHNIILKIVFCKLRSTTIHNPLRIVSHIICGVSVIITIYYTESTRRVAITHLNNIIMTENRTWPNPRVR